MGQEIEEVAEGDPGVTIVGVYDPDKFGDRGPTARYQFRCGVDLKGAIKKSGAQVVVEYSTAEATGHNLSTYLELRIPFVNGTTGWDYDLAYRTEELDIPCVVDQNMHPVLVAFKDALTYMAEKYPKVLIGYNVFPEEEHQDWKPKPSGTAPVWCSLFERMGAIVAPLVSNRFTDKIKAFHWYRIVKGFVGKAATEILIVTKIWGRRDYATGAVMAAKFVARITDPGVYDMRDVLQAL